MQIGPSVQYLISVYGPLAVLAGYAAWARNVNSADVARSTELAHEWFAQDDNDDAPRLLEFTNLVKNRARSRNPPR